MKKVKLLIMVLLIFICLSGCTAGEPSDRNLKRVKVGMTPSEVHHLMGKPTDTENNEYFEFQYWFEGATSIEDAQAKFEKGRAIKYYCVIFFAEDKVTFVVESKEDVFSGIWGKY